MVTALVDHPETLVGALLRQTTNLRNLWLRLPDLLFVWETVPVSAWRQAVKSFGDQLNASWESTPELGLLMTRDTLLANGFASLSGLLADADGVFDVHKELLHQAIPEGFPRSSELRLEAAKSPIGMSQIRMLLATSWDSTCTLHQVESWETIVVNGEEMPPEWLVSALRQPPENAHLWHLLQIPPALGFRRPVAFAPLVAALYAIGDVSPEPVVVECLKRLKAFDPTWFEAAYPNFLACAVAALAISDR